MHKVSLYPEIHYSLPWVIIADLISSIRGIVMSIVRFVEFTKADMDPDFMYLGVNMAIFTLIEPSSYFICSCLPGTRPLAQGLWKKLPRRTIASNGHACGSGSSASAPLHNSPTACYEAHNLTSISALQGRNFPVTGHTKSGFIKLEETVRVDYSSGGVA